MKTLLITPSYGPDFDRARLLLASCERHVSGIERHLLLIDEADRAQFQRLQSDQVELVSKESRLPWWVRRSPRSSRWWLSLGSLPVRGWILQQVMKLAIAEYYDAEALVFADSDMIFIKPFHPQMLIRDNKLRHYCDRRGPHMRSDRRYQNWYQFAAQVCGIDNPDQINGSYIAQLNSWRHENVIELYRPLEQGYQHGWMTRLLRCLDMSEYVLYGTYVDHCLGDLSGHYRDPQQLCHSSWFHPIEKAADVDHFVKKLAPEHLALHLQSNLKLDPTLLSAFNL